MFSVDILSQWCQAQFQPVRDTNKHLFFRLFFELLCLHFWSDSWRIRQEMDRKWHAAKGRRVESNPSPLYRGHSLCTWGASSTNWAIRAPQKTSTFNSCICFQGQHSFHLRTKTFFSELYSPSIKLKYLTFAAYSFWNAKICCFLHSHWKMSIFGFYSLHFKKSVWRHHLGLWETRVAIFHRVADTS